MHIPPVTGGTSGGNEDVAATCIRDMVAFRSSLQSLSAPVEHAQAAAVGYGWWSRTVRTAHAVMLLHGEGLSSEASPLVRTAQHHAAALIWLRMAPAETIAAIAYEYHDRRHKIGQKAWAQDWKVEGITLGPPPDKDTKPEGYELLRNFDKLCKRIGRPAWYLPYMLESGYAHASAVTADAYIEPPTAQGPGLLAEPSLSGVPLRTSAMFAGIATRELAELTDHEDIRALAQRVETRLGISLDVTG